MDVLTIVTLLILISALFSYLNVRFLKMPGTIGVMLVSFAVSLIVLVVDRNDKGIGKTITTLAHSINFSKVLLDVLLGFLLFASALHVDLKRLTAVRRTVLMLSTVSVLISTAITGLLLYSAALLVHIDLPLIYCLIFGALISPTDPIAVAAILKKSRIPPALETIISGESMFNDAVGLILFVTFSDIAASTGAAFSFGHIAADFGREVGLGIVTGLAAGWLGYRLMRSIHDFNTILLISVSLVFAVSEVATQMHASIPLAVVVAGLVVGNHDFGRDNPAHQYLVLLWKLIDDVLNTVLFVLIGLQLVTLPFLGGYMLIGLLAIAVVLFARFASIVLPAVVLVRRPTRGNFAILTWAGLRGGISVAMALSLPESAYREALLAIAYIIVVFSVLVQGLTLNKVAERVMGKQALPADGNDEPVAH